MVVVSVKPLVRFMDRAGMATSTRRVALEVWQGKLPQADPAGLVRELYEAENRNRAEPSGSQDMAGLLYPGVCRLDYDFAHEGGYFPVHVECNQDAEAARWLESVIHLVPVAQRPEGYSPLGILNADPAWIRRLGQSGKDCFDAIVSRNLAALGCSFNECMKCWQAILPETVCHPAITTDLLSLLAHYQSRYAGAMYSGCGGGYLYVVADTPVPGAFRVQVRCEPEIGRS
jgi:hypothetical protein